MIDMPLNRATPGATSPATPGESTADAPQGAFEEMLSRSLGHRLVGRHAGNGRQTEQDAADGNGQGDAQFYHGMIVTNWAPQPIEGAATVVSPDPAPATLTDVAPVATNPITATPTGQSLGIVQPGAGLIVASAAPQASTAAATTQAPTVIEQTLPGLPTAAANPAPAAPQPPSRPSTRDPSRTLAAGQPIATADVPATQSLIADPTPTLPSIESSTSPTPTVPASPAIAPGQTETRPEVAPAATPMGAAQTQPNADAGSAVMATGPSMANPTRRPIDRMAEAATESAVTGLSGVSENSVASSASPAGTPNVARSQHGALVNRVLQMVEHLQTQPPPRMVVVDMPELEGLRLMVAIQADGKVHVAPIAGSAPPRVADSFVTAVGEALAADGFDLADSGGDRRQGRRDVQEQPPTAPQRDRRARRMRRSSGLRL